MKHSLFAAAAAAVFAISAPAFAQPYPPTPPGPEAAPGHEIGAQIDALRNRVKSGFDQGQLSRHETERLYGEIDKIRAVAQSDRNSSGELSDHDRMDIQARLDRVSRSIHWERAEAAPPSTPPDAVAPPPAEDPAPPAAPTMAWTLEQREDWLAARIDHGADEHHLSGQEVARGQQELNAIRAQQAHLLERDGGALSETDRSYLLHRLDELNQTLRWEGRNPAPPWASGM
jgi:hypothetical protein